MHSEACAAACRVCVARPTHLIAPCLTAAGASTGTGCTHASRHLATAAGACPGMYCIMISMKSQCTVPIKSLCIENVSDCDIYIMIFKERVYSAYIEEWKNRLY